ncbi:MAG: hypothetical protein HWE22_10605 [Flavobacteriales bacterium]|nr:hypothetical protein [Flavobacteriales bacterium]
MIKAITVTLIILSASSISFSQKDKLNSEKNFYKLNNVNKVLSHNYIDSQTIVSKMDIKVKGSRRNAIFTITYNENSKSFDSKQVLERVKDYYKSDSERYFKKDGKTYRLRSNYAKKEYRYYIDEITDKEIIVSDTPFYSGTESDGLGFISNFHETKKFYIITLKQILKKENIISILYFDKDFNLKKKYSHSIGDKQPLTMVPIDEFLVNDHHFIAYQESNKETSRGNLTILKTNSENEELMEFDRDHGAYSISILFQDGKYLLYELTQVQEEIKSNLYELNIQDKELNLIDQDIISKGKIIADYNNNSKVDEHFESWFLTGHNCEIIPHKGDHYILNFSAAEIRSPYFHGDILVTKVSNNKISWNSYIRRSGRFMSTLSDSKNLVNNPFVIINNDNIQLLDYEENDFIDLDGNVIKDYKNASLPDFVLFSLFINMEDGNFYRSLE